MGKTGLETNLLRPRGLGEQPSRLVSATMYLNCTRSGTGAKQVIRCADLFHRSHIDWAESLGVHACNDVSKPALHLASR